MKTKFKTCTVLFVFAIPVICSGCRHAPQYMTENYGKSYNAAFNQQVINNNAPDDKTPVDSTPGNISTQIYNKKYIKGLTEDKKDQQESVGQKLNSLD